MSLIIRDAAGSTVRETEIGRQICIWGCRIGDCLVFRYALGQSLFPANVWRFESGPLEPRDTLGMWFGAAPCLVLWLWMTLVSQISPVLLFGLVAVVGGAWSVWRARHGSKVERAASRRGAG